MGRPASFSLFLYYYGDLQLTISFFFQFYVKYFLNFQQKNELKYTTSSSKSDFNIIHRYASSYKLIFSIVSPFFLSSILNQRKLCTLQPKQNEFWNSQLLSPYLNVYMSKQSTKDEENSTSTFILKDFKKERKVKITFSEQLVTLRSCFTATYLWHLCFWICFCKRMCINIKKLIAESRKQKEAKA